MNICTKFPCSMNMTSGYCHDPNCPNRHNPQPTYQPMGCICPPTSEKTCEAIACPRRNPFKGGLSGSLSHTDGARK